MENNNRIKLGQAVIVEGKYDRLKLLSIIDAPIFTTDGFGVFKENEKLLLFKKAAEGKGLIILTDPDGAGRVIRNYFNSRLPKEKLIHLYVPKIEGKEKRKSEASKEGLLGVEGMEKELLRELFKPFDISGECESREYIPLTSAIFFKDGFSGGDYSSQKREELARALGIPNMNAKAMINAVNFLGGMEIYQKALDKINSEQK